VTSSTGIGVGDVVAHVDNTNGAILGRVTAITATTATVASAAAGGAAAARVTRLPGAAASARLMTVQDVEPVRAVATGSPSGTASPQSNQEVGRLTLKADGDRDLSFTSLVLRKSGSNTPDRYIERFDLYAGTTLLSTIGSTRIVATLSDAGAGSFNITAATVDICTGNTTANNHISLGAAGAVSTAEAAHINVGDQLVMLSTGGAQLAAVTVTTKTAAALGACGAATTAITLSAIPATTADVALDIFSNTVYFDASVTNNNSAVTDIALASQTITQGSTLTLSVFADTSNVRTTLGNVIATFGLVIPGTAGGAGGLSWSYTPSGGTAVTSTISDNYPVNLPTLSY
jgi:hypothetical protein